MSELMSHWLTLAVLATLVASAAVVDAQVCFMAGYRFYQGKDSQGGSISCYSTDTPGDMAEACSKSASCKAFTAAGCTKSTLKDQSLWLNLTAPKSWDGLYTKNKGSPVPTAFACLIPGYTFYQGKDSPKGNVGTPLRGAPALLANSCSQSASCVGFNTKGDLKNDAMWPQSQWNSGYGWRDGPAMSWEGLYVKDTALPGYKFYQGKDSYGEGDVVLRQLPKDLTPRQLAANCSADPDCKAFNTLGYLKKSLVPENLWGSSWTKPQSWEGMYVKSTAAATVVPGYTFFQGKDSPGSDIATPATGLTPEQLAQLCNYDADCKGFNTNGNIKSALQLQAQWSARWTPSQKGEGLYVKDSAVAATLSTAPPPAAPMPPPSPPPSPPAANVSATGGNVSGGLAPPDTLPTPPAATPDTNGNSTPPGQLPSGPGSSSYEGEEEDDSSDLFQRLSRYEEDQEGGDSSSYTPQSSRYEEGQQGDDSSSYTPHSSSYEEGQQGDDSSTYTPQSSSYEEGQQGDDSSTYTPYSSSYEEGQQGDDSSSYTPQSSSYEGEVEDGSSSYIPQSSSYEGEVEDDSSNYTPHSSSYEGEVEDDSSSYTPHSSSYEGEEEDDSSNLFQRLSRYEEDQLGDDSSSYVPHSSSYEEGQGDEGTSSPLKQYYQTESSQDGSGGPVRKDYGGEDGEDDDRRRRLRLADGHNRKLKV